MGGYIAFEIMRQAPERVLRLALLDTAPRAERPEQIERRDAQIAMVREGRFTEVPALLLPLMVRAEHQQNEELRQTFADGIGGARLVIVPKSGHLSTLEQPEAVTRALTEWMAS